MKLKPTAMLSAAAFMGAAALTLTSTAHAWSPKKAALMTKWAKEVDATKPLPEYPRPQMVRKDWLNLNGVWEYQSGKDGDPTPIGQKLNSEILVPFPVESALSGVMEHHDRIWYRRTFNVPKGWQGKQLMLNFGAVDYEAEVFINGQSLGVHKGGYEPFSLNITPQLKENGPQEIIVRVFDPTEKGGQPRGKQTTQPGGIMYTPTTGIWQTVWLEPVDARSIQSLHIVPDVDNKSVKVTVNVPNAANSEVLINVKDGTDVVGSVRGKANVEMTIPVANPKLWSPDSPFLYQVDAALNEANKQVDHVDSYFGMRKISVGMADGFERMLLNDKFVFQMGPLDQGFWPDGIYTAPTDDALRSDIEMEKTLGFNMVRKHIKVEPARWYYWADKLGIMVWQDMPSPNSYIGDPPPIDKPAFEKQVKNVIQTHWNSPAIIMWVIFNESQARHDTIELVNMAKALDPSRLVNRDSGAGYEGADNPDGKSGDVDDVHSYPPPAAPNPSDTGQATACGEYGGIGYVIKDHLYKEGGWGYTTISSAKDLEDLYGEFAMMLKGFRDTKGLSAAVYTEITDVEIELNGLMTYDRILKCDPKQIALANRFQYPVPTFETVIPTSETQSQTWKYTFDAPAGPWSSKAFDEAGWKEGPGGFGTQNTPGIGKLGTEWNTSDIWLRRIFTLPNLTAEQIEQLVLRDYHDDDVEVFINGVSAYKAGGYVAGYESKAITPEAKKAIVPGGENVIAIHCHQNMGGQYIDAGLSLRIPPK